MNESQRAAGETRAPTGGPAGDGAAAPLVLAATLLAGSELIVSGVGVNPTRTGILDILRLMGADLRLLNPREAGGEPVAFPIAADNPDALRHLIG